jgi:D-alanine-D-alanine ligase
MGGTSAEREISLKSGEAVSKALRGRGHDVVDVDAGPDLCSVLDHASLDVAFLALHGGTGEDGSVQGLLEVLRTPYTGSGVLASAMAMDKVVSKVQFSHYGLPVPRFEVMTDAGAMPSIPPPLVVKPSREGSSVGVSIVKDRKEIPGALEEAVRYSGTAVVEEFIAGKEVDIGILGDRVLGGVEVRPKLDFYSYEAKYTAGMTEYLLPPELADELYERAKETGLRAHQALGCSGASRVDLLIDEHGNIHVLEVNTIPGMTETSLLPKIAARAGYEFPVFLEEILEEALSQWERKRAG